MKIKTKQEVLVESIKYPELGLGAILDITYKTGKAMIHIEWPDKTKGLYCAEELEFLMNKKD